MPFRDKPIIRRVKHLGPYPKAAESLIRDRHELRTSQYFPAQHVQRIHTSNPIEDTFATIRQRAKRNKGCLSRDGTLRLMFKLGQNTEKSWRKLCGFAHLTEVSQGVDMINGIKPSHQDQTATCNPLGHHLRH